MLFAFVKPSVRTWRRPAGATWFCWPILMACAAEKPEFELDALMLYVSEAAANANVSYLDLKSGKQGELLATPSAEFPAAAASDGSVAIVTTRDSGGVHLEELLLVRAVPKGRPERLLAHTAGRARNPQFSRDARWLYLEADYAGFRDIYRVDTRTRKLHRLTKSELGSFEPALSPDGSTLAFVSSEEGNTEIYTMAAAGGPPQRLTAFHRDDVSPRWSADGRRIAFISNREGSDRIFIMNVDGTAQQRVSSKRSDIEAEADPVWSPTGGALLFSRRVNGRWRLVLHDPGAERELTPPEEDARFPAFSPDGKWIAYTATRNGNPDIALMRSDGSDRRIIVSGARAQWLPLWVPH